MGGGDGDKMLYLKCIKVSTFSMQLSLQHFVITSVGSGVFWVMRVVKSGHVDSGGRKSVTRIVA